MKPAERVGDVAVALESKNPGEWIALLLLTLA